MSARDRGGYGVDDDASDGADTDSDASDSDDVVDGGTVNLADALEEAESDPDPDPSPGPSTGGGSPSFPGGSDPGPAPDPDPPDPTGGGENEDTGSTSPSSGGDSGGDSDPSPGPATGGGEPSVPGGVEPEPPEPDEPDPPEPDPTPGPATEAGEPSVPGGTNPDEDVQEQNAELREEAAEQNPRFDPTDFTIEAGTVVVERDEATGGSGLVDERLAPGRRAELTDQARLEAVADANEGVDADDLQIDDGEIEARPGAFDDAGASDADPEGDQTTAADDSEAGRLEQLSQQFNQEVVEPAGDVGRNLSPVSPVEEAVFGTDVTGEFNEAAVEGAVSVANVPGAIVGAREGAETLDDAISRGFDPVTVGGVPTGVAVPDIEGRQAVARDAGTSAGRAAEAAASNPVETAGLVAGSAATGLGASRLTTGVARRASRLDDSLDAGSFVDDTRAQTGGGRRSTADTEIEQETIEVEEVVGEEAVERDSIENIPGVSVQSPTNRVTRSDQLGRIIEDAGREADDVAEETRDLSPRARAERRVPDADEFPGGQQARQAEIEQLEARFRSEMGTDTTATTVADTASDVDAATATTGGVAAGATAPGAEAVADTAVEPQTDTVGDTALAVGDLDLDTDAITATDQVADTTQDTIAGTTTTTDTIGETTTTTDTVADTTATTTTTTATTAATAYEPLAGTDEPRPRLDLDDLGAGDGANAGGIDGDSEAFTNPTQSLTEVDDALTDDLGGFDAP